MTIAFNNILGGNDVAWYKDDVNVFFAMFQQPGEIGALGNKFECLAEILFSIGEPIIIDSVKEPGLSRLEMKSMSLSVL